MEPLMPDLADCLFSRWSPGLGDPHPMGWVTVGIYLLAASAAGVLAVRGQFAAPGAGRERVFWALAAALLLALAINKQLDLQSALTAAARCLAQAQGWYEDRRAVQVAFILGLAMGGLVALVSLTVLLQGTLRRTGLALLGLVFVTLFVVIRAAGFHHMDALINTSVVGVKMNWTLELSGPFIVLAAALRQSTPLRK
jgi:hypothetical protein